jgi:ABC-type sugar transport system, periplasmic component
MKKFTLKRYLGTVGAVLLGSSILLGSTVLLNGSAASVRNQAASSPINLTFWHSMGGVNAAALQTMVNSFNSQHTGKIKVTTSYQGSYDDALNKFKTAMVANSGPDILQSYDLGTRYLVDSGFTDPVQNYINKDKWNVKQIEPNIAAYYTVNGKLNSMPFNSSTPILYYNKAIFKKAGIADSSIPKTFADIEKLAPKLTKKDSSGKVTQSAVGLYVYGWFMDQSLDKLGVPLFNNGNGRTKAPTKVVLDSNGGGAAFLKAYQSLVTSGAMPTYAMDYDTAETAFENQKLAIYIDSTAELGTLLKAINGKFDIGTGYFPKVNANSKGGVSVGGASLWMTKNSDSAVQEAKWQFIQFMVSAKEQAYWNTQTGYFPVNTGAYNEATFKNNVKKHPQFQTAIDQLRASSKNSAGGLCAVYTQVRKIQETEMQKMLNKQESEAQALKNITSQCNSAISDYNKANG